MKKNIHPEYREVYFLDVSIGTGFVCRSTVSTKEETTHNGKKYPLYRVSTSSASHPLFTGSSKLADTEGRVDRFNKRYANAQNAKAKTAPSEEPKKEEPKKKGSSKK